MSETAIIDDIGTNTTTGNKSIDDIADGGDDECYITVCNKGNELVDYFLALCNTKPDKKYIEDVTLIPFSGDYPLSSIVLAHAYEEMVFCQNDDIWFPALPRYNFVFPFYLEGKGPNPPFPFFEMNEGEFEAIRDFIGNLDDEFDLPDLDSEIALSSIDYAVGLPYGIEKKKLGIDSVKERAQLEEHIISIFDKGILKGVYKLMSKIQKNVGKLEPIDFQALYQREATGLGYMEGRGIFDPKTPG